MYYYEANFDVPLVSPNKLLATVDPYFIESHERIPISHNEFIFGKKSTPQTPYHGPLLYTYVTHHIHAIYL